MLQEISWNEFLLAASGITAASYVIIAFICYIQKLMRYLRSGLLIITPKKQTPLQPTITEEVSVLGTIANNDSITKSEQAMQRAEATDVIAAPLTTPEEEPALYTSDESARRIWLDQLLRDIDTLRSSATDFSKDECLSMLQIIFQNYEVAQEESFKQQITTYTLTAFADFTSFSLTPQEVEALWAH